jgi:hypothetical protein
MFNTAVFLYSIHCSISYNKTSTFQDMAELSVPVGSDRRRYSQFPVQGLKHLKTGTEQAPETWCPGFRI